MTSREQASFLATWSTEAQKTLAVLRFPAIPVHGDLGRDPERT